jgi:tRNA (guanine26-N2/guanine27-N2)-dimethyltransferase
VEKQEAKKEPHAPLPTTKRLHGLLTSVSEELPDQPLYFLLPNLCSTLRCVVPPRHQFVAQMEKLGYKVSAQHKEPDAIKTDAPNDVVWDVLRNWVRLNPISAKRAQKGGETWGGKGGMTASMKILETEPKFTCDFEDLKSNSLKTRKKAVRYPMNPEPNWGPKARAIGKRAADEEGGEGQSRPAKKKAQADAEEKNQV